MARVLTILLSILAAFGPGNASASALPDWGRLDRLATGRAIAGPAGWLNWCMGDLARCRPVAWTAPIPATPELLGLLETIHDQVGRALAPRPEPAGQDLWRVGVESGDCEDYALAKQQRLLAAGVPAGGMRLAIARLPHGELHAVLTVETDRGTIVLDNLQSGVVPLNSLPYAWLTAEGDDRSLRWRELVGHWPEQHPQLSSTAAHATARAQRPGATAQ